MQKTASLNSEYVCVPPKCMRSTKFGRPENGTNFNHSHVDFLGSSSHVERRRMHSPTILPTRSEAACCTVCVFNTGAMWISTLCAGLLTSINLSWKSTALLSLCFALHGFASSFSFAFAWGPALKILLWCDESLPILDTRNLVKECRERLRFRRFWKNAAALVHPPPFGRGAPVQCRRRGSKMPGQGDSGNPGSLLIF